MHGQTGKLYIVLLSIHGLIRGKNLELGRDADTGGQILYVLELAQALARHPDVGQVDLITRRVVDTAVAEDYAQPLEMLTDNLRIVRVNAGPDEYIPKEQLWDHLDAFADNVLCHFRNNAVLPDIIHSHYADAGYVGASLTNQLGVPLIHTGHSLGRVKRHRLLASGLSSQEVEERYNMARRIEAEETTLASAERVITSTHQEIKEQYELYDHYQPEQMRVLPPGTNLKQFMPPTGKELNTALFADISRHLKQPTRPIILALSRPDRRKNIVALVEAYGQSPRLQEIANLVIVAGNRDDIDDLEEGAQEVFHELLVAIDRYDVYSKVSMPKCHRREQVPLFYCIAAASGGVFVNPALTEPFGLTLIEAAASGLPIVATEDGGPRDIIGNCKNGFLIDPLETSSISDALLKLLEDRNLWQQCVEQGLKGVREHYSWESHAESYLSLVRPIIERSEVLERKPIQRRQGLYRDRAIVSDLDQNLIGDEKSLRQLVEVLRQHRKTTKFIVATGRRFDSALRVMRKYNIPEPDILITSSGTEIYYAPKFSTDISWSKHLDYHWSPHKVKPILAELPGLKLQPKSEQSRFKISYYIDPEIAPDIETINSLLHKDEQSVHLNMAFGQFLDVVPIRASKGLALRYVAERWQIPLKRIIVAGGSGADEDMMRGNTLAVVVANRHHEELSQLVDVGRIYFAKHPFAAGILEAFEYYDFFNRCEDPKEKNHVHE
ncbi:HAD-IIB family hydrolase [Sulfuriflexus mobilis]|uniref:HAD-IIB family hydrolase n=1 Tax=Sulfuriflexus mobilis TaxID=1811807 RepID=UPI000F81E373|nr:HAD-IIB family hydrolase [Sulfuriflexus mobilis]